MLPDVKAWHTAWVSWSTWAQRANLPREVLRALSVWFEEERVSFGVSRIILATKLESKFERVVSEYQKRGGTDSRASKNMVSELAELGVDHVLKMQEDSQTELATVTRLLNAAIAAMAPPQNQVDPLMGFFYDKTEGLLWWLRQVPGIRPRTPQSASTRSALGVVTAWCATGFFDKPSMELLWEEAVKEIDGSDDRKPWEKSFASKECPIELVRAIEAGGLKCEVKKKGVEPTPFKSPAL